MQHVLQENLEGQSLNFELILPILSRFRVSPFCQRRCIYIKNQEQRLRNCTIGRLRNCAKVFTVKQAQKLLFNLETNVHMRNCAILLINIMTEVLDILSLLSISFINTTILFISVPMFYDNVHISLTREHSYQFCLSKTAFSQMSQVLNASDIALC